MSDNQDDIARRVRALLAKTVENGCTEAEALAAAAAWAAQCSPAVPRPITTPCKT